MEQVMKSKNLLRPCRSPPSVGEANGLVDVALDSEY